MAKYIDKKVDGVVNTIDKSFTELLINTVKERFGVRFTFAFGVGIRLFLFRCNRRKYLRHIIDFPCSGHFLPGWKLDKEVNDIYLSYGWSEKYIKDYMIVINFSKLSNYSIRLDKCTWLRANFDYSNMSNVTITFYGRNVTKWVYILQRTVLEYNGNMDKITSLQRIVTDKETWTTEPLFNKTQITTFNEYCIDEKIKNEVMNYINNTIVSSRKIESKFKSTYAPGIMFYGAPGTGKSSIIEAIANELHAKVVYIDLSDISCSIKAIQHSFLTLKQLLILVYEDIDFLFTQRDGMDDLKYKANYNTLLQLLDGYLSLPNTINIATTNHIEKLDEALIRDGRFDLKIELKGLDEEQAKKMCDNFEISYDILNDEEYPINPAYLQGKIFKKSKEYALNEIKEVTNKN